VRNQNLPMEGPVLEYFGASFRLRKFRSALTPLCTVYRGGIHHRKLDCAHLQSEERGRSGTRSPICQRIRRRQETQKGQAGHQTEVCGRIACSHFGVHYIKQTDQLTPISFKNWTEQVYNIGGLGKKKEKRKKEMRDHKEIKKLEARKKQGRKPGHEKYETNA